MNMKSIAEELGISVSTVSRVINGNQNFSASKELREKILLLAAKTGYSPNPVYQAMRKKDNRQIAIILPSYLQPAISSNIAEGVDALSRNFLKQGYNCHYLIRPLEFWKNYGLPTWKVSGAITVDVCRKSAISEIDQSGIPYVSLNGVAGPHGFAVLGDDAQDMTAALEYLYRHGHRRIAYINLHRPPDMIPIAFDDHHYSVYRRWEAYLDFCRVNGLEPVTSPRNCDTSYAEAIEAALAHKCTAILTYQFRIALEVNHLLHQRGLCVPRDISLMSFDDSSIADLLEPAITSLALPCREMGLAAGKILLERRKNSEFTYGEKLFPGTLIERQSVAQCTIS